MAWAGVGKQSTCPLEQLCLLASHGNIGWYGCTCAAALRVELCLRLEREVGEGGKGKAEDGDQGKKDGPQ